MDELSKAIRDNPLSYLPEPSLTAFWQFRRAYDLRFAMESKSYSWQDGGGGRAFAQWVCARFQLRDGRALSHLSLISSFCVNEEEAFDKYFELLDEFEKLHVSKPKSEGVSNLQRMTLGQLLRAIREDPEKHLVQPTFKSCCAFLMGDSHAYEHLKLPIQEDRVLFESFKTWVETEKNRALPRPWFKVISFWSGGIDCSHSEGAFSVFFKWLDEYGKSIGKAGLFC